MAKKILSQGKNLKFNSSSNKAKIIKIFGESTQATRSGINELMPFAAGETSYFNSIEDFEESETFYCRAVPVADNWIKVECDRSGETVTTQKYINFMIDLSKLPKLKPNTTYTFIAEFRNINITRMTAGFNSGNNHSGTGDNVFTSNISITGPKIQSGLFKQTITTVDPLPAESYVALRNFHTINSKDKFSYEIRMSVVEGDYTNIDYVYEEYGQMPSPEFPSEIVSVSGKNLIPVPYYSGDRTLSGVEFKVNADGSILANGTATADGGYTLVDPNSNVISLEKGQYTLSGITDGGSSTYYLQAYKNGLNVAVNTTTPVTIPTETGDKITRLVFFFKAGVVFNNFVIKPMFEKGTVASPFIPYNHIGFKSLGKNYLDIPSVYELIGATPSLPLSIPTGTYIISADNIVSNSDSYYSSLIIFGYEDGTETSAYIGGAVSSIGKINFSKKVINCRIYSDKNYAASLSATTTFTNLMISKEGGKYEPYKEVITAIPFDGELRSLPDGTKDRLYTSDGKSYYEQRVNEKIIKTNEGIWEGVTVRENTTRFYIRQLLMDMSQAMDNINIRCSHFPAKTVYNSDEVGIYLNYANANYRSVYISVPKFIGTTIEEIKEWFDEHEVKLQYGLAESITTEIGDEVALTTFIGENNVECPSESVIVYEEPEQILEEIRITNSGKLEPFGLTIDYNKTVLPLMAEAIEANQTVAGADGDIVLATTYGPKLFELVAVTDDFLSPQEKEAKREEIRLALDKIKNKTTKLVIEPMNRTYVVKYSGLAEDTNMPKSVEFRIPLKSSYSHGISNERYSTSGEEYFASNTQKDTGAIITLEGPATYPSFSLNGIDIKLNHILAEGARLIIDTNKYTVEHINRIGTKANYMQFYNKGFPKIQNGANILFVNNGIGIRQIKIEWNDLLL